MKSFSPFSHANTKDLTGADLAPLAEIPEGWFIEYKELPCNPKDYGKEAAAFANTHGGWMFVGLAEDASRKPAGGPGVPLADAQRLLDSARDGITHNLNPAPALELKIVAGPIDELGIPADRAILVIRVPESVNPPHIHTSGRVYKRQADVAYPVELNNRGELDHLYSRATQYEEVVNEYLGAGLDYRWVEDFKLPWLHLAVIPDPAFQLRRKVMRHARFRELIAVNGDKLGLHLPNICASAFGHVARNHSQQEQPTGPAVTLEYAHPGRIYTTIPLPCTSFDTGDLNRVKGERFERLLREATFPDDTTIINGTKLAIAMSALGNQAARLMHEQEIDGQCLSRVTLFNTFRCVPYFDSPTYLAWCEKDGVPVLHRDRIQVPERSTKWSTKGSADDVFMSELIHVLLCLGVPDDVLPNVASETLKVSLQEVTDALDA